MGFLKKQLLKVIEWKDNTNTTIVYRYIVDDRYAIMKGSKLVVNESQVAIFTSKGRIADVFAPGTYSLDTGNIPILTKLCNWKYAFENPKEADVYFVNTKQFTNVKFGTTNPIMMRDADFGAIRLRGFGNFSFRVSDAALFMREIFGTVKSFTTADIENHLKNRILATLTDSIGESKIPALDLCSSYIEIGDKTKEIASATFAEIGIEITQVTIQNLSLPPEVEKALDERSTIGILSDKMGEYQQYNATKAMRDMAAKPSQGGVADMGMNMSAGIAMGQMMAQQFGALNQQPKAAATSQVEMSKCSKCGAQIKKGAKFCPECGAKQTAVGMMPCPKCGAEIKSTAKFCPECGANIQKTCPKCGVEVKSGAKFCPECGEKL